MTTETTLRDVASNPVKYLNNSILTLFNEF